MAIGIHFFFIYFLVLSLPCELRPLGGRRLRRYRGVCWRRLEQMSGPEERHDDQMGHHRGGGRRRWLVGGLGSGLQGHGHISSRAEWPRDGPGWSFTWRSGNPGIRWWSDSRIHRSARLCHYAHLEQWTQPDACQGSQISYWSAELVEFHVSPWAQMAPLTPRLGPPESKRRASGDLLLPDASRTCWSWLRMSFVLPSIRLKSYSWWFGF